MREKEKRAKRCFTPRIDRRLFVLVFVIGFIGKARANHLNQFLHHRFFRGTNSSISSPFSSSKVFTCMI